MIKSLLLEAFTNSYFTDTANRSLKLLTPFWQAVFTSKFWLEQNKKKRFLVSLRMWFKRAIKGLPKSWCPLQNTYDFPLEYQSTKSHSPASYYPKCLNRLLCLTWWKFAWQSERIIYSVLSCVEWPVSLIFFTNCGLCDSEYCTLYTEKGT